MYQFKSRVRYSETDEKGQLSAMGIMNYLQDCTLFHTEDCGLGMEWLHEKDRAWLLSAWQISIHDRPRFKEEITITTRAYDFKGSLGYRYFEILNEQKEAVVCANSIWCYVQPSKMRPVKVFEEDSAPFGMDEAPYWEGSRKIAVSAEGIKKAPFIVRKEHLDTNHHVNNAQYVNMAMECLPEDYKLSKISVEYKTQAHLGDTVIPVEVKEENRTVVILQSEAGLPYALVAFN